MNITPEVIQKDVAAGNWKSNAYLTNLSTAYLQKPENYAKGLKLFPRVPVQSSAGYYYIFDKAAISRDNVSRKPQFGKVAPVIMGNRENTYNCVVDQVIIGIDKINDLNWQRTNMKGLNSPHKAKTIAATEMMNLHIDIMFSRSFFNEGIWQQEVSGTATTPSANQFYQFDNKNSDPIKYIQRLKREIEREGRRKPNKLALGTNTFDALCENSIILERIKYGGSTPNPATVTENVLAQLFGVDEIVVMDTTYNTAPLGAPAKMEYICDSKGALLLYAPNSPAIDEPSAGYTFSWDPLGNGQPVVFSQWDGEAGTHSEFIEGLCAYDMKKTGDDMAVYLKSCVS